MVALDAHLATGEHVLVQTRAHTAVLGGVIARAVAAVGLLGAVVALLRRTGHPGPVGSLGALAAGALAVVALARLLVRVWEWDRTVMAVTEKQVVVVSWALRRRTHAVPLGAIRQLRVRQGICGRLLGYGTIVLENAGRSSRLAYVPEPRLVAAAIGAHAGRDRAGRDSADAADRG
jgi:membrane protein YdbS with pleckstrin-like domain